MTPTPDSPEAIKQGCDCPRMDNRNGHGYMGSGQFWISKECPLHGTPTPQTQEPKPA